MRSLLCENCALSRSQNFYGNSSKRRPAGNKRRRRAGPAIPEIELLTDPVIGNNLYPIRKPSWTSVCGAALVVRALKKRFSNASEMKPDPTLDEDILP